MTALDLSWSNLKEAIDLANNKNDNLKQETLVRIFKNNFKEVLDDIKNEISLEELEWNLKYMKVLLERARNDNIVLSLNDTLELAQGETSAVWLLATLRKNDKLGHEMQWEWAVKAAKETVFQNKVALPSSNELLEELTTEIEKIGGTLVEKSGFMGRTIITTLKVMTGNDVRAETYFDTGAGKNPTGLKGMKKGKQKYLACLSLVKQLKEGRWSRDCDIELVDFDLDDRTY
ncbi:hypothetical protein [Roseateles koreensis]|uniref:Uncharacterized protein n=1 Tax=Roseateles koreensis TaxID=2987526 RepID=A0ABT5KWH0_9BURK|nr:hypothetical protein [Roseateles koreensis]MDC8787288.1 hypothetical protein [Roseateles koreensis]